MRGAARTAKDSPARDWRALRHESGLSLDRVCELTGIHKATLSHIETRRMFPEPREAAALLRVYGWPSDKLGGT
jgi:transcriptional regulator with XRE-family HTH domain